MKINKRKSPTETGFYLAKWKPNKKKYTPSGGTYPDIVVGKYTGHGEPADGFDILYVAGTNNDGWFLHRFEWFYGPYDTREAAEGTIGTPLDRHDLEGSPISEEKQPVVSRWDDVKLFDMGVEFEKAQGKKGGQQTQEQIVQELIKFANPYDIFYFAISLESYHSRFNALMQRFNSDLHRWAWVAEALRKEYPASHGPVQTVLDHLREVYCGASPEKQERLFYLPPPMSEPYLHPQATCSGDAKPEARSIAVSESESLPAFGEFLEEEAAGEAERNKKSRKELEEHKKKLGERLLLEARKGNRSFMYCFTGSPIILSSDKERLCQWVNSHENYSARVLTDFQRTPLKISVRKKKPAHRFSFTRWWSNFWGGGTA